MTERVRARRKARQSDEANDLAAEHVDLVQQIVNQVAMRYPRHVDRAELWSAGATGLVEASRSYRPETGIPFHRYAAIRIHVALDKELEKVLDSISLFGSMGIQSCLSLETGYLEELRAFRENLASVWKA